MSTAVGADLEVDTEQYVTFDVLQTSEADQANYSKAWNRKYNMRFSARSAFSAVRRRFGHRIVSIRKDL